MLPFQIIAIMTDPLHTKHPKLNRPKLGLYGRAEFALLGTTCARIDGLLQELLPQLSDSFRVLAITGKHGELPDHDAHRVGEKVMNGSPSGWNEYDDQLLGKDYDLVLVNGNHYPAARQIVFVDPKKAGTLERRKEQLTDVAAVIFCPGAEEIPDWLQEYLGPSTSSGGAEGPWSLSLPNVRVQGKLEDSHDLLLPLLRTEAAAHRPPLKALILAGGKSSRMGTDKGQLVYRQETSELQRMIALCRQCGLEPHLSVAAKANSSQSGVPQIADRFAGMGPMGAICTAFLTVPDSAWLVLACDLPLLEADTLQALISARDSRKFATAIKGISKPFPEPLVAIYEPRAYSRLLQFLSLGRACPRKMLINSDVALLEIEDESPIANANTPEERAAVLATLKERI